MVTPIPRLELAQWKFEIQHAKELGDIDVAATKQKILDLVQENSMSNAFYKVERGTKEREKETRRTCEA